MGLCYNKNMRTKSRYNPLFGIWLEERRGSTPQVEYAGALGISPAYYALVKKGHIPSRDKIIEMAFNLGEDPVVWLEHSGYSAEDVTQAPQPAPPERIIEASVPYVPRPSTTRLPMVGVLRGGTVVMAEPKDEGEFFPCLPEHAEIADYVVRVEGDSLFPLILEGDLVAVRRTATAEIGQIAVAQVGDSTYMKRYGGLTRDGKLILESINPMYPPIHASPADSQIIGIITWSHRTEETMRKFGKLG